MSRVLPTLLALLVTLLPACAPQEGPTPPEAVARFDELVSALRAGGVQVQPAGEVDQAFFGPTGQVIEVYGETVQVFEYESQAARVAESELIAPDGASIGTTMVTWVDRPTFWAQGRLIVLYVGSDEAVIRALTSSLGEPIAQGPAASGG